MARKTIYCAQAFWWRSHGLEGGEVYQFRTSERALAGGEILSRSAPGVAVFSLTGEPDVDYWDEPILLWSIGSVPRLDGREVCAA